MYEKLSSNGRHLLVRWFESSEVDLLIQRLSECNITNLALRGEWDNVLKIIVFLSTTVTKVSHLSIWTKGIFDYRVTIAYLEKRSREMVDLPLVLNIQSYDSEFVRALSTVFLNSPVKLRRLLFRGENKFPEITLPRESCKICRRAELKMQRLTNQEIMVALCFFNPRQKRARQSGISSLPTDILRLLKNCLY